MTVEQQAQRIELSQWQIDNLARPILGMVGIIEDFYKNPQNQEAYREWYYKKYGYYPDEEIKK